MKKSLEAVTGDYLVDIRTGSLFEVLDNSPFLLQNDSGPRVVKDSEIRRWFKVAQMSNVTSNIVVQPVQHSMLSMDAITVLANQLGCTLKHNKDHTAVKYNNKNVMEIRATKKYYNLVFRHGILNQANVELMENNYNGRLVGNGTWTLDYRIQTTDLNIFELVLKLAITHISR